MRYDLETELSGSVHRSGVIQKTLDAALVELEKQFLEKGTTKAHLFEDGTLNFGSGRLVAVYTLEDGWTKLAADPRPWWETLSESTRRSLLDNPSGSPSAEEGVEICQAGGSLIGVWWVDVDPGPEFTLPVDLQAFVRSQF